ncbi:Uncharacterised protein [Chlamydia trachomatis]|nr:Uncharacterised protein [Chlamydia trachomatis]
MTKKFELLSDDTIVFWGRKLFRIRALISFGTIEKGDLGGYVEKEENLSQYDNAWVCDNARVCGNARVKSSSDYIVFKNTWSSFRWFTYTKSNQKWKAGCFYGTGEELIKKAYEDSEKSGKHYELYVNLVAEMEKLEERE